MQCDLLTSIQLYEHFQRGLCVCVSVSVCFELVVRNQFFNNKKSLLKKTQMIINETKTHDRNLYDARVARFELLCYAAEQLGVEHAWRNVAMLLHNNVHRVQRIGQRAAIGRAQHVAQTRNATTSDKFARKVRIKELIFQLEYGALRLLRV